MHQGSFISNTPIGQLDDFRKEVRGKMNHMIDQPKQIYTKSSNLQQLLRHSISPKQPKNHELNKSQDSSNQYNQISSRLSFQRSSLDLGKPTQNILYPKIQLQDILPLNKILELQRAINNYNYPTNNNYFIELKKLAKIVLRETQG
ncbi:unnamed protein product [Paramecium primaurelia]|uniref:Uncharacterized protein n=1 Tax=Paramecium primaurelia TaxID=5886 RepID=A0A8S1K535_PARPR|nr:unnamed protein product [Paramecium primaurelia]